MIYRFADETNANPKPFTWTKDPIKIIAAVKRGHLVLDSIHSHAPHLHQWPYTAINRGERFRITDPVLSVDVR